MSDVENSLKTVKEPRPRAILTFNPVWEELFFFSECDSGAKCLICLKVLNIPTKSNIKRHYFTLHDEEYGMLQQDERIATVERLKIEPPIFQTKFHFQVFKPEWELLYFFTEHQEQAKCLICLKTLYNKQKSNIQRHYSIRHGQQYDSLINAERIAELQKLKEKFRMINLNQPEDVGLLEEEVSIDDEVGQLVVSEDKNKTPLQSENLSEPLFKTHPKWEKYFFIEYKDMAVCLICMSALVRMTKYNIERHYSSKHEQEYAGLTEEERISEMKSLKAKFIITEFNLDPVIFLSEQYERENVAEEVSIRRSTTSQKFDPKWEKLYFFVEFNGMPKCLICSKILAVSKKYNLQRHYLTVHHEQCEMLNEEQRRAQIKNLKDKLFKVDQKITTQNLQDGSEDCNVKPDRDSLSVGEIKSETLNIKDELEDSETKCYLSNPLDTDIKEEVECVPDTLDSVKSEMQFEEVIMELPENKTQETSDDIPPAENHNQNSAFDPNAHLHRRRYSCNICPQKFSCKVRCNKHRRLHVENQKFKCESCNASYFKKDELASHMEFHVESNHVCEICNKKFPIKWSLTRHLLRHSKQNMKRFVCGMCNKQFTSQSSLNAHSVVHTADRPFSCDICSKRFSRRNDLKKHVIIHEAARPYCCNLCGQAFVQKNDFLVHEQRHLGFRPFLCEYCGKTFYRISGLMKHMLVHRGQKPYVCDVCNKSFYSKGNIIEHMHVHMGTRPYVCEVCNKTFNRKNNLRIHKFLHQKIRPHVCVFCNKGFAQERNLRKHLLIH